MLKVTRIKPDFLKMHRIGKKAQVITLSEYGFEITEEEAVKACEPFDYIFVTSDDLSKVSEQSQDLSSLLRKLQKINPDAEFLIETSHKKQLKYLSQVRNLTIIVRIRSDEYDDLQDKVIKHFNKQNTIFCVEINNIHKLEDVLYIFQGLEVSKNKVFIKLTSEDFKKDAKKVFLKGQNLFIEYRGDFFVREE